MTVSFNIRGWSVDVAACELSRDGTTVKLTPRAMAVLEQLATHPGDVVTLDDLLQAHWPRSVTASNAVHKVVAELRHALGNGDEVETYIETVPKRGYRLVVHVKPNASNEAAPQIATGPAYVIALANQRSAILVPPVPGEQGRGEPTFLESIQLELAARIAQLPNISVARSVPEDPKIRAGAAMMNADYRVELTVQTAGTPLHVSLVVTPRSSELPYHEEQFTAASHDRLTLLNDVITQAIEILTVLLDDRHLERMREWGTRNLHAYKLAREGDGHRVTTGPDSQNRAADFFRRALIKDPGFKYAFVALSSIYYTVGYYARVPPVREKARLQMGHLVREASAALHDDEALADITSNYRALSIGSSFDTEELWRGEIVDDPRSIKALGAYARLLRGANLLTESELYFARAIDLAAPFPEWGGLKRNLAFFPGMRGDLDTSIHMMKRNLDESDDIGQLWPLIRALAKRARYQEAESYLSRLRSTEEAWAYAAEILLWAFRGDIPLRSAAHKRAFEHPLLSDAARGHVCFILGDVESGVRYWRQMEIQLIPHLAENAPMHEVFWTPNVVGDPRYQSVLDELGAGQKWRAHMRERAQALAQITGIEVTTTPHSQGLYL